MRAFYTITSQTAQVRYAGNGVTTAFSVTFQFFEASTLRVRTAIDDAVTTEVLDTDYTVSGGDGSTGTVTFMTAPPSGTNVIIDLSIPMLQETVDLSPNGPLPAEDVEQGFDRIVTMVKQLRQQLLAVPELDATFNPDVDDPPILPPPSSGKVLVGRSDELGWENGTPFENAADLPVVTALLADQDVLEYDNAGAVWRNRTLATVLGRMLTTRGDIFLRGASAVSRLALGAANRFLKSNGTDLAYGQVDLASSDVTGVLPRANGGFTPSQLSNILSGDVAINNTSDYFTGPTVAQGSSGTWLAWGTVTINAANSSARVIARLTDGTNVRGSTTTTWPSGATPAIVSFSLSGIFTSPPGDIRIEAKNLDSSSGGFVFNQSGNSADCHLNVIRIA